MKGEFDQLTALNDTVTREQTDSGFGRWGKMASKARRGLGTWPRRQHPMQDGKRSYARPIRRQRRVICIIYVYADAAFEWCGKYSKATLIHRLAAMH